MAGYQPAFNARLIAEVKKYPCLYNHSKRGSGDTTERMRIWNQIAVSVDPNCSGEFAKKRWLQLRDRYRKELKVAIRQNFSSPVRWCYFSHLSWLDPYLKDNLALSGVDALDFKGMEPLFAHLKAELDEGIGDEPDASLYETSLERVLAATQRQESISPALENDESGPQSVGTSGDDDRGDLGGIDAQGDDTKDIPLFQQPAVPSFSIKEHIVARQAQHQQMQKNVFQAASAAMDWLNDEDLLYGRIIGLKMKSMETKKRKRVRAQILSLLEDSDDDEKPAKIPRDENDLKQRDPASPAPSQVEP